MRARMSGPRDSKDEAAVPPDEGAPRDGQDGLRNLFQAAGLAQVTGEALVYPDVALRWSGRPSLVRLLFSQLGATDDGQAILRLELAVPGVVPVLPHIVQTAMHGHVATLVTDHYDEAMLQACAAGGATVQGVERLTLEEIFVTTVMARREEVAA